MRRHAREQCGDPRYLDQVLKCVSQRRAILGLDAQKDAGAEYGGVNERKNYQVILEVPDNGRGPNGYANRQFEEG